MKILFLIRSLNLGGAERQLVNVAKGLRERGHDILVVTFYSGGDLEKDLSDAHIAIHTLGKRRRWDLLGPMINMIRLVQKTKPAAMCSYLPSENFLAITVKAFCPDVKVLWGLRSSDMDLSRYDWFTRFTYQVQKYLAPFANLIVANSHAGRDYYIARGFPERKVKVIHNGIDADRFKPDQQAGKEVRSEWGIRADEKLVGLVGRLDPMKDHPTFMKAAALLAQRRKDVRFVCVGDGPANYRDELFGLSIELGLVNRLIWAGAREEIESVYNALDVMVSSSAYGEGFSNVIGEAIACGVPCVATDVGDSSLIVSSAGMIVPPNDVSALEDAMDALLARGSMYQPGELHLRIATSFGQDQMVSATEEQLSRIVCQRPTSVS